MSEARRASDIIDMAQIISQGIARIAAHYPEFRLQDTLAAIDQAHRWFTEAREESEKRND